MDTDMASTNPSLENLSLDKPALNPEPSHNLQIKYIEIPTFANGSENCASSWLNEAVFIMSLNNTPISEKLQLAQLLSCISNESLKSNLSKDLQKIGTYDIATFEKFLHKYTTKAPIVTYMSDLNHLKWTPNSTYLEFYKHIQSLVLKSFKHETLPTKRDPIDAMVASHFRRKIPKAIMLNPAFINYQNNDESLALIAEQISALFRLIDNNYNQAQLDHIRKITQL